MSEQAGGARPRTFYLNEQHELTHSEKSGGGRIPQYVGINWTEKGQQISRSLTSVRKELDKSKDPVREQHYFILARPLHVLTKKSKDEKKAPHGTVDQKPNFAEHDSQVFRKLGLDLIQVYQDGTASVHAKPENLEQLTFTSGLLEKVGAREQARWATIESFGPIPANLRIDQAWLKTLKTTEVADAVVELQPLLARLEIESVMKAISGMLKRQAGEAIRSIGTDFSGRQWLRAKIARSSLLDIAEQFFSVQALHSPLLSAAAQAQPPRARQRAVIPVVQPNIESLPSVAVLDTGVPSDHPALAQFRRGQYIGPDSFGQPIGDHGSLVASRVVFGDPDIDAIQGGGLVGRCRYYDVLIATTADLIDDKAVVPAMESIVANAPDVRVFNLSFDAREPWASMDAVRKAACLSLVQDLDNFIFARDAIAVVAAGNSPQGVVPATAYPNHINEPAWALGPWARGFNSLTCGSFVERLTAGGLVSAAGLPSPFTKIGPGLCGSPKPDFSEHGGNSTSTYSFAGGHGVWCFNASGQPEDRSGTSFAAPVLARQAAFAFQRLQEVCEQGTRPFASTVKAFLALTATGHHVDGAAKELADLTLGMGRASADRLSGPLGDTAVLVWQGIIEGPDDMVRVQLPIPREWIKSAEAPVLRLVVAWDSPVNAAVSGTWACRKVVARLRPIVGSEAVHGSRGAHSSYPLSDRRYDLKKITKKITPESDTWLLEISYEQIAEYFAGIDFTPQQRVSFAAELFDAGKRRVSPQVLMQSLPIASMQRLSIQPTAIRTPVVIKSRG